MIPRSSWYAGAAALAAVTSFVAAAARPDDAGGGSALDGAQLFNVKGCAACHDGPDSAAMTDAGPSLASAWSWAGDRIEGVSGEEYVAASIRSPSAFISPSYTFAQGGPGGGMPLLRVSDGEIDAIVAFLLASTDGNE